MGAEPFAGNVKTEKRKTEIWDALYRVIDRCKKEKTQFLFIAGDLFHRQPLLRELKEVDYLFSTIPDTKVVMIAGNHDYIKKDSYYRSFRWSDNVFLLKSESMDYITFPEQDLAVYGLSYYRKEITEALYDHIKIQDKMKHHVLLAHGGDALHIPFNKVALEASDFDYIALGHIHKPQTLIANRMAYAGALEPIDREDTGPHGYVEGEITEKGCNIRFVSDCAREYVHMKVMVDKNMTTYAVAEKVRTMIKDRGQQHLYSISLEGFSDPDIVFDLETLRRAGNIVDLCDHTRPAYDFKKLRDQNEDNLIGKYIESFNDVSEESVEYSALCEGIRALMETKRGQA